MRFIAYVETNRVGSRVEVDFDVDDEDLEGLDDRERESLLEEYARDVIFDGGHIEWGWRDA